MFITIEVEYVLEECRGCVQIRRSDWSVIPGGNLHSLDEARTTSKQRKFENFCFETEKLRPVTSNLFAS